MAVKELEGANGHCVAQDDKLFSRGLATWREVEDIESEGFFPTPAVYFYVKHDVKEGGRFSQVVAQSKTYPVPYCAALL